MSKRSIKQSISSKERQIKINTELIPEHVRDSLAEATLEMVNEILRQPGGRETLDAMAAARKAK